ncbi:MAG TPA: hypothetical protein VMJ74_13390 [Pseudomonadales bacterium]|nr:hypothetical protein [Pseudomonadales bacterium]
MSGQEPTIESLNADLAELEREIRALKMAQQRTESNASAQTPASTGTVEATATNAAGESGTGAAGPAGAQSHGVANAVRTAVEDTVAASFVATEATIDEAGGWFVTLSELGAIHNDQAKALFKDTLDTLKALRNAHSAADVLHATFDHWNRRATHVAEGLTRAVELFARESRHASTSVGEMWRPVIDLVRADARRG